MPESTLHGAGRKVKLDDTAFGARFRGALVHQSVRAEQAARRRGTAATRTRGEVSGSGAKPWRQKGTGRARAGSNRSPLWTGGGIAFGPRPRAYTFKVNRKEQRAALRSALSLHAGGGPLYLPRAPARTQDADPPGRGIALRRARRRRAHYERQVQAQAPRRHPRTHAQLAQGDGAAARRREHPRLPGPAGAGVIGG